jgi:hypothetical protein
VKIHPMAKAIGAFMFVCFLNVKEREGVRDGKKCN